MPKKSNLNKVVERVIEEDDDSQEEETPTPAAPPTQKKRPQYAVKTPALASNETTGDEEVEEEPQTKKKSGRGVMTPAKVEALAKARAARMANLKKYGKDKRDRLKQEAEEYFDEKVSEAIQSHLSRVTPPQSSPDASPPPKSTRKSAKPSKPTRQPASRKTSSRTAKAKQSSYSTDDDSEDEQGYAYYQQPYTNIFDGIC